MSYYDNDPGVYNDADIETMEFHAAGRQVTARVCPRCDDMLDPTDRSRWGDEHFDQPIPADVCRRVLDGSPKHGPNVQRCLTEVPAGTNVCPECGHKNGRPLRCLSRDEYADLVGPHGNICEGYHDRCMTDDAW